MFEFVSLCIYVRMFVCTSPTCIRVCTYVCIDVFLHVCMCLHVYVYLYLNVHIHVYVCIHVHTHTHHHTSVFVHIYLSSMLMILNKVPRKVTYLGTRYYY